MEDRTTSRILARYVPDRYLRKRERQTASMLAGGDEGVFRAMTETEGWGLRKDQSSLEPDEGGVSHRQRSGGDIRWSAVCQSVAKRHARCFKSARKFLSCLCVLWYTVPSYGSSCEREGNRPESAHPNEQISGHKNNFSSWSEADSSSSGVLWRLLARALVSLCRHIYIIYSEFMYLYRTSLSFTKRNFAMCVAREI